MRPIPAFFARLLRDQRGTSLIEMSLILPVLVMLGCGATDLALCYAQGLKLQQAAARTMELAIAAGFKSSMTSTLQSEGATAAGVPSGNVAIDLWLECDGTRQTDYNGSCSGSSPARFASVTITSTYNWMFEQVIPAWNNQPYSVPLKGYAEVRIQ
ncbi:TadE/TadG family type IV pilus assembly protein [Novosphingobium bradum]|uniref:TadE/TadG family type IV pilus assembly protein n=1 Tax=Novosphingobium bradum TaxID=1737444 RepID=A0ABV7INQ7_9SPHN